MIRLQSMLGRPRLRHILAAFALALCPLPAGAESVLLGPLHVVDVAGGEVRTGRMLLIRDGVIESELPFNPGSDPPGRRRVNAYGGFAIPGLAEMHAHVPSKAGGEQRVRDVLTLYLANGITTIRGMLGEPWHLELRELLATGAWEGPRLITSGPSFNGRTVTSPEQAAQRVREQAAAGYDFLKLHPGLEAEEYGAIAAAAAEVGVPFGGHVPAAVGLHAALRAGQRTIDHLDGYVQAMLRADSALEGEEPQFFGLNLGGALDPARIPELAQATARAGVWNVPTQSLLEHVAGDRPIDELMALPEMGYVSAKRAKEWRESLRELRRAYGPAQRHGLLDARRKLIAALQEAGAGLLLGSDAPQIMNVPGFSIHAELEFLVGAGLTPLQALAAGTLQVARFLADERSGEIAPGHVADLVVLGGNPLGDISATRRVIGVMRAGRWYDRAWISDRLADIAGRGI